jgi:hypothetical protein
LLTSQNHKEALKEASGSASTNMGKLGATVIIIVVLLVSLFFLGITSGKFVLTGRAVEEQGDKPKGLENYSWTKAICNKNNECVDVLITCERGEVASIEMVSKVVEHPPEWSDSRGNLSEKLC